MDKLDNIYENLAEEVWLEYDVDLDEFDSEIMKALKESYELGLKEYTNKLVSKEKDYYISPNQTQLFDNKLYKDREK